MHNPVGYFGLAKLDDEVIKKLRAGEVVKTEIYRSPREYGACMKFESVEALKNYDGDPFHQLWTEAYKKVRVEGTTTLNFGGGTQ